VVSDAAPTSPTPKPAASRARRVRWPSGTVGSGSHGVSLVTPEAGSINGCSLSSSAVRPAAPNGSRGGANGSNAPPV
jgi:hypothetical protein